MVRKGIVLLLLLATGSAWAKKVPPVPTGRRWVQDYANVLDADQELFLLRKLKSYYDSTSTEIVIVTENTLDGDDVFDYSYRLAEAWGLGGQGKDNGVLIYAAIQDRKVFIQVGRGAEGALPDIYAKRVVESQLKPSFKKTQYGRGFHEATDVIIQHLEGEFVNEGGRKGPKEGMPAWVIVVIMIIVIFLFSSGGNNGSTYDYNTPRSRGRGGRPSIWMGGGFGGGGFGGSSSGGGFGGGFGGGSFGGGGAGGSW